MEKVQHYYSPGNLYDRILKGLEKAGADLTDLDLEDLQPVDEFHIRGSAATKELIAMSGFHSDMHILDIGCGIGGSTRRLTHETGCRTTGVDLSEEYTTTAARLTELLGMQDKVSFRPASALALPFEDNSFDGAWTIQMGMNIDDKTSWLKEMYRVMKPGACAVLYEVCANVNSPIYFPVPWAQDSSMSFLVLPDDFREQVKSTGFSVEEWYDKTDLAQQAFANMEEPKPDYSLPALGVYMLVGDDVPYKAYNLRRNLDEARVSLIQALIVKP
ncbi:MAG: methyltransferase domain-containing protein [Gammaproteobacteria bacterium]|nr:methyltransferase domain-containing protein [Gammaproteobacteria bacterium]